MDNYSQNQIVDQIRQMLAHEELSRQESIKRCERIELLLNEILSWPQQENSLSRGAEPIMVGNGQILSLQKPEAVTLNDFDVILDLRKGTLTARRDPGDSSALKPCRCRNLGSFRLQVLRYMLENPGRIVSVTVAAQIYKTHKVVGNNLTKAIAAFRSAIQNGNKNGPYLLTANRFAKSGDGPMYMMNPQWRYLVIK
jgi:hypothetical protein